MPGVEDWGKKEEWISTLRVGEIAEDEGVASARSFDRDKIALKVSLFIHGGRLSTLRAFRGRIEERDGAHPR